MRKLMVAAALALALSACASSSTTANNGGVFGPEPGPAPPLPTSGPILYQCADGTQLTVTYQQGRALVAIVGGVSMQLPSAGAGYYSNGRYGLRGAGAQAQWEVGRAAPVACRGS
jgi:hypothetical protein